MRTHLGPDGTRLKQNAQARCVIDSQSICHFGIHPIKDFMPLGDTPDNKIVSTYRKLASSGDEVSFGDTDDCIADHSSKSSY